MNSVKWDVHRGELLSDNLCAWDGSRTWPTFKREKEQIVFLIHFNLWNQSWASIVENMLLYQMAKLESILVNWFSYNLAMWVLNIKQKSVQRIKVKKELIKNEKDLAKKSTTSLPRIPKWLETHRHCTTNPERPSS